MRPGMRALAAALGLALSFGLPAAAWEDHDQLSRLALEGEAWAGERVLAEPLEAFLEAEAEGLVPFLAELEAGLRRELPGYPPLPEALAFEGRGSGPELREAFLRALRLNPALPLPLFLQLGLGEARRGPELPVAAVDLLDCRLPNPPFQALAAGEETSALALLSSASDEPDYGMDIGLFSDNGTGHGAAYGLGAQPYGIPALSYGSQAPLHMSFPSEDPLIKLLAPFTQGGLAAYRIRLFESLARYAFRSGHRYWGYRFAGWTLHYLEDLSQPYHASLLPGLGLLEILALNAFGSPEEREAALVFVSNRHALVEDYLYRALTDPAGPPPLLAKALRGPGRGPAPAYREGYAYDKTGAAAYRRGRGFDRLVRESFPALYVSDPAYDYSAAVSGSERDYDPYASLRAGAPEKAAAFEAFAAEIFADIGGDARSFMAWVLDPEAPLLPRRRPLDLRGPAYLGLLLALLGGAAALGLGLRRRRRARAG